MASLAMLKLHYVMRGITRQVMHGLTCHAEVALSSAAVELSAAAIAGRMLPTHGQPSSDAWYHASSNA